MAPLPVIADVFRVSFEWESVYPDSPINVVNISCPTGDEADVAAGVEAAFQPSQFDFISSAYSLSSLFVTKLDGVSAGQRFPLTPVTGGASGEIVSEQTAVVSLGTTQRGPRGRGRIYLGPTTEAMVAHGVMTSMVAASIASIWQDWANAMIAGSPSQAIGVASYLHADWNQATTITCKVNVGTQVRRLRRTRP
jgi:hypothetical protein